MLTIFWLMFSLTALCCSTAALDLQLDVMQRIDRLTGIAFAQRFQGNVRGAAGLCGNGGMR